MYKTTQILCLLVIFIAKLHGQSEFYNENFLRYDDYIYEENIATVQILKPNAELRLPSLLLNSNEKLVLTFDDLNSQTKGYFYKIILCNQDWTPADLMEMEYINGLTEIFFNTSQLSFNTTKTYSHYEVMFPANEMKITRSGNYLLYVYSENTPDKPILTRRFYVYENLVNINAQYMLSRSPQNRLTHQEINLQINKLNYYMPDVYNNLIIKIQQNERKDNIKTLTRPKRIEGENLIYNLMSDIEFEAGNEYRKLDLRSLIIQSATMNKIEYTERGYEIYLLNDLVRAGKKYINYQDINGKYRVINWDNPHLNANIESDYGYVHFSLPTKQYNTDGEYYLIGEFTQWRFDQKYKLNYNPSINIYETTIYLKQAYYDYNYIFLPNKKTEGTYSKTEGNFSETENDYHIIVYHRDPGELNDKIIGLKTINNKKVEKTD